VARRCHNHNIRLQARELLCCLLDAVQIETLKGDVAWSTREICGQCRL
jgi:hypothetical protein